MTTEPVSLYEKYVDYVTRLHNDLDNTVAQRISPEYRAQLLSYEDFCRMWHRWGNTEGLQETWRRRFDLGYDRVALDLCERLEAAIIGKDHVVSGSSAREAA